MQLVFIAGPFRARTPWEIEQNVRLAETVALEVWRKGYACICPHANTRFFQDAAPDELWLRGMIEIMSRCDIVLMVGDWTNSEGAKAEREKALGWKKTVLYSLLDLPKL